MLAGKSPSECIVKQLGGKWGYVYSSPQLHAVLEPVQCKRRFLGSGLEWWDEISTKMVTLV